MSTEDEIEVIIMRVNCSVLHFLSVSKLLLGDDTKINKTKEIFLHLCFFFF